MLTHGPTSTTTLTNLCNRRALGGVSCSNKSIIINSSKCSSLRISIKASLVAVAAAALVASSAAGAAEQAPPEAETLSNIPQTLSGECKLPKDCKRARIQKPKSRKAESCTTKCVTTCIRGGEGSPGEGPFNVRGPLVVFKEGFRSRRYCLVECSDICNLIGDKDDGP
ncbi:hypothetical protein TorRG33x02_129970 [Trema orientale]|uniref:Uncharacterized protein n=1 Tax=Trema orientale TaxID=63057 RepID=A0A2P5F084_TREOI|nr:hypothetical protein TorRG33x02_129970 [Trema orientale]